MKVFGLSKSLALTTKIVEQLCIEPTINQLKVTRFKDGEFEVEFTDSIRGENIYIVQSTVGGGDSLMELCLAIDAAKRASAKQVIAVIPYYGWARQDRKSKPRVSIGAKVVANMLQSVGCDRVITVDLHADQEQGFFDIPVDHIHASSVIYDFLKNNITSNSVIVSPDLGASKRANKYSDALKIPMAVCLKVRNKPNEVASIKLIGDVKGKDVFVIDDMIDTAGTICKVAFELKHYGAKTITVIATHGLFSGDAMSNIGSSPIDRVIVTDTIEQSMYCLSVAGLLAEAIKCVETNKSISALYSI